MALKLRQYQPRVAQAGIPGYRQESRPLEAEALGDVGEGIARAGQGLGQLGRGVDEFMQRVTAQDDAAATDAAYAKLTELRRNVLEDPNNGLLSSKGIAAKERYEAARQTYQAGASAIIGKLTPAQQKAIAARAERNLEVFRGSADEHVRRQFDAYSEDAHKAVVSSARQDALSAASRGEFDAMQLAIVEGRESIGQRAANEGWSADRRKQEERLFETDVVSRVVGSLLDQGRSSEAQRVFEDSRRYMDEAVIGELDLEKKIQIGVATSTAQSLASNVFRKGIPPDVAREYIMGLKDGEETRIGDNPDGTAVLGTITPAIRAAALNNLDKLETEKLQAERQADVPLKGKFEQRLYAAGAALMSDLEFEQATSGMSDEAKGWAANKRRARIASAQARNSKSWRDQNNRNAEFRSYWESLDPEERATADIDELERMFETDVGPVEPHAVQKVKAAQKKASEKDEAAKAKAGAVTGDEFTRIIDGKLALLSLKSETKAEIKKYVNGKHANYVNPKGEGLGPDKETVDAWVAEWFQYGEKKKTQTGVMGILEPQPNMYRVQAEMKGIPFESFEDTPGGGKAPPEAAAVPVAGGKVVVVGPKGTKPFQSPEGPELDKWLASHPGWKRQ